MAKSYYVRLLESVEHLDQVPTSATFALVPRRQVKAFAARAAALARDADAAARAVDAAYGRHQRELRIMRREGLR